MQALLVSPIQIMAVGELLPGVVPRRYGVIVDRCKVILEYEYQPTGKRYLHTMSVDPIILKRSEMVAAESLVRNHAKYFPDPRKATVRLASILKRLNAQRQRDTFSESSNSSLAGYSRLHGDLDLNKLSDRELNSHKQIMNKSFERSFISPNDPSFLYDKRHDFENSEPESNDWDD